MNVDSHKLTLVPEMQICSVKKATTLQEKFGLRVEYPIQWGVLLFDIGKLNITFFEKT